MSHDKERRLLRVAKQLAYARRRGASISECNAYLDKMGYDSDATLVQLTQILLDAPSTSRNRFALVRLILMSIPGLLLAFFFGNGLEKLTRDGERLAFSLAFSVSFVWLVQWSLEVRSSHYNKLAFRRDEQRTTVLLMLAERKPLYALQMLLRRWVSKRGLNPILEAQLSHLILHFMTLPEARLPAEMLAPLRHNLAAWFELSLSGVPRTDLSDTRTDILVSLIQLLGRSQNKADRDLLAQIGAFPATFPNRILVRDAALVCGQEKPVSSAYAAVFTASTLSQPSQPTTNSIVQRGAKP